MTMRQLSLGLIPALLFMSAECYGITAAGSTTDANSLRDSLIGAAAAVTPVGSATLLSGPDSAGFFTDGTSVIGIESGIVLSTGSIFSLEGPNEPNADLDGDEFFDTFENVTGFASEVGDPLLDAITPIGTYDTTALEFSFTTTGGDLFFNYVFASDEYNEFANGEYNDTFGFFLDGQNIAIIPGDTQPVSINTVNGGNPFGVDAVNPQFYNNNDPDDGGAFLDVFEYDGFTDVFTAAAFGVTPGTHTLRLTISDASDQFVDSAVFIQGSSFASERSGNPSFDSGSDVNVESYDFGELDAAEAASVMGLIANLDAGPGTVAIDMDTVVSSGDDGLFQLTPLAFSGLVAGDSQSYTLQFLGTDVPGDYSVEYALSFVDALGVTSSLTLSATALVLIPEPGAALLALACALGASLNARRVGT